MPFASIVHEKSLLELKLPSLAGTVDLHMDGTSSQAHRKSEVNDALPALPTVGQLREALHRILGTWPSSKAHRRS